MSREKRESIPSSEQSLRDFNPVINGKINCHIPHNYNWALGYATPPAAAETKRREIQNLPAAKINGNYLRL